MIKKICLFLLLFPTLVFAHSGRLDGQGGHRLNKEWIYDGRWIEIKNNIPELRDGMLTQKAGDYHFHCKPSLNKINSITYRDGIYIPSEKRDIKNTITTNVKISNENVIASKEGNLYHKSDCRYIKNIKENNVIIFEDKEDAEKSNYLPDKNCFIEKTGGAE